MVEALFTGNSEEDHRGLLDSVDGMMVSQDKVDNSALNRSAENGVISALNYKLTRSTEHGLIST
jgi:hypothetical protein